jgi:hypothetical protein
MRARLLFAALFLLWPAPSSADPWTELDVAFVATVPVYAFLATEDAYTTVRCVRAGTCHEANPVYRPIVARHGIEVAMGGKLAAQAGLAAGAAYAMHRWPQKKKYVVLAFATMTVLQGVVNAANRHTLARGH